MARPIAGHIILSKVGLLRKWLLNYFTRFLVRKVVYDVRDRKDITPITLPCINGQYLCEGIYYNLNMAIGLCVGESQLFETDFLQTDKRVKGLALNLCPAWNAGRLL